MEVAVLGLTQEAQDAISGMLATLPAPATAGVRLALPVPMNSSASELANLSATLVGQPDAGDEIIEQSGVRVFMRPELAELLDDKLLDAHHAGEGEQLTLATRR